MPQESKYLPMIIGDFQILEDVIENKKYVFSLDKVKDFIINEINSWKQPQVVDYAPIIIKIKNWSGEEPFLYLNVFDAIHIVISKIEEC